MCLRDASHCLPYYKYLLTETLHLLSFHLNYIACFFYLNVSLLQYLAFESNLTLVVLRAIEIANGVDEVYNYLGM